MLMVGFHGGKAKFVDLGQIKKMNCFSGTAASVLKVLHYFFYCFLKMKIHQIRISSFITSLSVMTMLLHLDVVVHCE